LQYKKETNYTRKVSERSDGEKKNFVRLSVFFTFGQRKKMPANK
jgi:hypothetical protein